MNAVNLENSDGLQRFYALLTNAISLERIEPRFVPGIVRGLLSSYDRYPDIENFIPPPKSITRGSPAFLSQDTADGNNIYYRGLRARAQAAQAKHLCDTTTITREI